MLFYVPCGDITLCRHYYIHFFPFCSSALCYLLIGSLYKMLLDSLALRERSLHDQNCRKRCAECSGPGAGFATCKVAFYVVEK